MKSLIFTLALLFTASAALTAQGKIEIIEGAKVMKKGTENAFTVLLQNTKVGDIEERWAKFMKNYDAKGKKKRKQREVFSDNAKIKGMSDNTVDVYAYVQKVGERDSELSIWYDLGGAYLSSAQHPDRIVAAETMINRFARSVMKTQIEELLKIQKKDLKELNKDLDGMKKDKSKLEDDIKNYEKKIEEAKQKIEENIKKQGEKEVEIKTQEEVVKGTEEILKTYNN